MLRDKFGMFESKNARAWKYVGYIWIAVFVMAGINYVVSSAVNYHLTHSYGVRSPLVVKVETRSMFWSESKPEPVILSPLADVVEAKEPEEVGPEWLANLTPLEKKVCDKWGIYECKNAVARCRAESGCDQERDGKTIVSSTDDVGVMQINRVHWDWKSASYKEVCDLSKIVTEDGNLECAMVIYQASGWTAWSTTHNGQADAQLSAMK